MEVTLLELVGMHIILLHFVSAPVESALLRVHDGLRGVHIK
jgi:hypothetical protein